MSEDDCIKACQQNYESKIRLYQSMFESTGSAYYHNLQWLQTVETEAKNEFDACMKACQG